MTARWATEDLGLRGVFDCLKAVHERGASLDWISLAEEMLAAGDPSGYEGFNYLLGAGLVAEGASGRLLATQVGRRTYALMCTLNNVWHVDELARFLLDNVPSTPKYRLVTAMAADFIMGLQERPDFARIYICSPWISFSDELFQYLMAAIATAERRHKVEIEVLTRPQQPSSAGVEALRALGANVVTRDDLHTKLYIREPGPSGGLSIGMLGSQNLTRSQYEELGIAVRNDSVINAQLVSYFWTLQTTRLA